MILKRVKASVEGAGEMGEMEHLLNVYVQKNAPGACADFRGYIEATRETATPGIGEGLWLMWRYEGRNTLSYYLRRKDTIQVLARDMGVPEDEVVQVVVTQILEALRQLHAIGLVHRDVKPLNIILCEQTKRMKLIDLGACADLRNGTNFNPAEAILDPLYAPPENYVLPMDVPDLAKQNALQKAMLVPMLWMRHKPDRFDVYGAGLILMQLCCPWMRSDRGLKEFGEDLQKCKYNLIKWRKVHPQVAAQAVFLGGNGGWDLAATMLMPREGAMKGEYRVQFNMEDMVDPPKGRIAVSDALAHPFLTDPLPSEALPATSKASMSRSPESAGQRRGAPTGAARGAAREAGAGPGGGVFSGILNRINDIRARTQQVESATRQQTIKVQSLTLRMEAGEEVEEELSKEVQKLTSLQQTLGGLQSMMSKVARGFQEVEAAGDAERADVAREVEGGAPSEPAPGGGARGSDWFSSGLGSAFTSGLYGGLKLASGGLRAGESIIGELLGGGKKGASPEQLAFVELLGEAVPPGARTLAEVESALEPLMADPRYVAVPEDDHARLCLEFLEASEQCRVADFEALVAEHLPEGRAALEAVTYADLSRRARKDPRFAAVDTEAAREQAFARVVEEAVARATPPPAPAASAVAVTQGAVEEKKKEIADSLDPERLERIKSEHARLKAEYEEMEKTLRKLEELGLLKD